MSHLSGTLTAISRSLTQREAVLPIVAAAATLSASVVGAALVEDSSGTDGVNNFVQSLSDIYLQAFKAPERFGFAFNAGMASSFNPSTLFLIFAYPALYLGTGEYGVEASLMERLRRTIGRAVVVGGAVVAGLFVSLAIAGTITETGALSLMVDVLPWLALATGVLLTLGAGSLLGRSKLYAVLARQADPGIGNPGRNNVLQYFLFGLAFAAVSLSSTLPIFLATIGSPFSFVQFVQHAIGRATFMILATLEMALLILALTLVMALLKVVMAEGVRNALPRINTVRTVLMTVYETVGILSLSLAGGVHRILLAYPWRIDLLTRRILSWPSVTPLPVCA